MAILALVEMAKGVIKVASAIFITIAFATSRMEVNSGTSSMVKISKVLRMSRTVILT